MTEVAYSSPFDLGSECGDFPMRESSYGNTRSPVPHQILRIPTPSDSLMLARFFDEAIPSPTAAIEADVFAPDARSMLLTEEMPTIAGLSPPGWVEEANIKLEESSSPPAKKSPRQRRSRKDPGPSPPAKKQSQKKGSPKQLRPPPPRRVVRRSKKPVKEETPPEENVCDFDGDFMPEDPRRRRVLERNRIAATKCRLRKRDEATTLADLERQLSEKNKKLTTYLDDLTADIYHLKTQLLRHTDCNCELIQKYIAAEAKKSVNKVVENSVSPDQPMGTGSISPEYGTSRTSTAESLALPTPDLETVQTPWPVLIPTPTEKPQFAEFGAIMGGLQKISFNANAMVGTPQIVDAGLGASYDGGLYIHQPSDAIHWDAGW